MERVGSVTLLVSACIFSPFSSLCMHSFHALVCAHLLSRAMRKMDPYDCVTQWWIPVQQKDSKQSLLNRISDFLCTLEVCELINAGEYLAGVEVTPLLTYIWNVETGGVANAYTACYVLGSPPLLLLNAVLPDGGGNRGGRALSFHSHFSQNVSHHCRICVYVCMEVQSTN